ncbi:MAG: HEAT repeat domain-containing protein, partial [Chloroflexi bacterium]|nr:HEAT repeat domain-containing protein [Chloroflexota bacterium]
MKIERIEESASTSPQDLPPQADEGSSTGLPGDVISARVRRPGPFMAAVVLGAALALGGTEAPFLAADLSRRRRDDVVVESSTAMVEVDPILLNEVRELFEQGASEFFQDGVHSSFSRTLIKMLAQHGRAAFRAIAEYLFSGNAKPDVASEALRWLADFNDPSTFSERWTILQHTLRDRSPQVRDGAILGFASLDDPRARPLLSEARDVEQV